METVMVQQRVLASGHSREGRGDGKEGKKGKEKEGEGRGERN